MPAPTRAGDQELIDRAVERGVGYLRKVQQKSGLWSHNQPSGATALAGLALLECGVLPGDPAVRKAAEALRKAGGPLTLTYSLAAAVLFFDRLGEGADVPLIQAMGVRLLAGQDGNGGWGYHCPLLPPDEARRLTSLFEQLRKAGPGEGRAGPGADDLRAARRKLVEEIRRQVEVIDDRVRKSPPEGAVDDNSNTQFAVLALWVARRHGVPVEGALRRTGVRFCASQAADGGWGYKYPSPSRVSARDVRSTPTMTCAGLLSLAAAWGAVVETARGREKPKEGDGSAAEPADPRWRRAVGAALTALGTTIDHPVSRKRGAAQVPVLRGEHRGYYFLWSLERVVTVFGLRSLGGKDWYAFGSEVLVANQQADGSWGGEYTEGGADTCFALLFLRRANLARDLTAVLKREIEDLGEVALRAGGVGGAGLRPRLAPGLGGEERSAAREVSPEAALLSEQLVGAPAARQEKLLARLRDGQGAVYTEALAHAIARLDGVPKKKAREALAERLAGMKAVTLRDKVADDDPEVRRAAALACAMKEDRTFIPRLIELLDDPEPSVARAAYAALKSLTGQDFGPAAGATPDEQKKAVADWKAWWVRHGRP
jgi:hypothetical protein